MTDNKGIAQFLDEEGRIIQWPHKHKLKLDILKYLAEKFEPDTIYTEHQINDICTLWHTFDDYFLLRRELVDFGLLGRERDGSRYWRVKANIADSDTQEITEND